MSNYLLKRLLLVIPTLFGIMLITFLLAQVMPGGPVERVIAQLTGTESSISQRIGGGGSDLGPGQGAGGAADTISSKYRGAQGLEPEFIKQLEKQFGFDKPAHERFFANLSSLRRLAKRLKINLRYVDCDRKSYLCAGWTEKGSEHPGLLFYNKAQWSESFHDDPVHRGDPNSHREQLEAWLNVVAGRHKKKVEDRELALAKLRATSNPMGGPKMNSKMFEALGKKFLDGEGSAEPKEEL